MNPIQPRFHRDSKSLALAYFNRAANYYRQAYYAQAIQHYLAGLEFDPVCVEVHADLAKAYEMLGCWNQALESLNTALQLRPGDPIALRRKKRILEEKEIYDTLTVELNLDQELPHPLSPCQQRRVEASVALTIEREFFTLTYIDTIPPNVLTVVCQLIERTYHEVGEIFRCYPQHKISISIEEARWSDTRSGASPPSNQPLPIWAAASYDGSLRLIYRSYSNSGFGILLTLIRHEWAHLLVDLLTHRQCPTWLDEGLAQVIGRPLMNSEREYLQKANQEGQLLTLHALQKPFSQLAATQRRLAYLQACAIVEYLVQQFGFPSIRALLMRIGNGKLVHHGGSFEPHPASPRAGRRKTLPSPAGGQRGVKDLRRSVLAEIAIQETLGQTADGIVTAWQRTMNEV